MPRRAWLLVILATLAVSACSTPDEVASGPTSAPVRTASQSPTRVLASPAFTQKCGEDDAVDLTADDPFRLTVHDHRFDPRCFIVEVDASVEIKNEDSVEHTWTIDGTLVDAPLIPGETYTHGPNTGFLTPGTAYSFHCSIHPKMTGTIIVV